LVGDYGLRVNGNGYREWVSKTSSSGYWYDGVDDVDRGAGGVCECIVSEGSDCKTIGYGSSTSRYGESIEIKGSDIVCCCGYGGTGVEVYSKWRIATNGSGLVSDYGFRINGSGYGKWISKTSIVTNWNDGIDDVNRSVCIVGECIVGKHISQKPVTGSRVTCRGYKTI
jgi:hypothetical protein